MNWIPSDRRRQTDSPDDRTEGVRPSGLLAGLPVYLAALVAAFGMLVVDALPAEASKGDASLHLTSELANANRSSSEGPHLGAGIQSRLVVGLSDFWGLSFGAETGFHPPASPGDDDLDALAVQDIFAGFRYNLDVFVYVPYIELSAVAYPLAPKLSADKFQRANVGGKLTVGIDWRFDRSWSLGGLVEMHAVGFDMGQFPSYSAIGFNIGYHFRL